MRLTKKDGVFIMSTQGLMINFTAAKVLEKRNMIALIYQNNYIGIVDSLEYPSFLADVENLNYEKS